MRQYRLTLEGASPLLMHQDNLAFEAKVKAWQTDPATKALSVPGDDRSPAWRYIGSIYHDGHHIGVPSDNIMTLLREGGAKVSTGKSTGDKTFKKATQSGIVLDQQQMDLFIGESKVPVEPFRALIGNNDFVAHVAQAEALGLELLVKRAKVGTAKHVRVRPMFRQWRLEGSLTVLDEETSGLTEAVLRSILMQAGALVGLGDWRPSSPRSSGTFGRFTPTLTPLG